MFVDINYDLTGGGIGETLVIVEVSSVGGTTWTELEPGDHLRGNVGPDVPDGKALHIEWNAGYHAPHTFWPNCHLRITAREILTIMLPGNVPLKLVKIPAGSFTMGSPETERGRYTNEGPQTQVTLTEDFYIGMYPVTQEQWLAVRGSWPGEPSTDRGLGDNYPAYLLSWDDAQLFLDTLNVHLAATEQDNVTLSLTTEARWEYAARAGTTTRFYFGDSLSVNDHSTDGPTESLAYPGNRTDYMWFLANNDPNGNKVVVQKRPNAFGLYDMHGNVSEWVQDWYAANLPGGNVIDPSGPANGTYRVFRSNSWSHNARQNRSAKRTGGYPNTRAYNRGFRVTAVR